MKCLVEIDDGLLKEVVGDMTGEEFNQYVLDVLTEHFFLLQFSGKSGKAEGVE